MIKDWFRYFFFDLYIHYIKDSNIVSDIIWNLDVTGFEIRESINNISLLVHNDSYPVHNFHELVTALEMIPRTGKVGKFLITLQKPITQQDGFLRLLLKPFGNAASHTGGINDYMLHEWGSRPFLFSLGKKKKL